MRIHPKNPDIVYVAALGHLFGPNPARGVYRSKDGGDTWVEITGNPGIPKGVKGKIGIAVSPADSNRVYASVEAEDGGIFRSDDAGATWTRVNGEQDASDYTEVGGVIQQKVRQLMKGGLIVHHQHTPHTATFPLCSD